VTQQQIFNLVRPELEEVEKELARQSSSPVRTISEIGKYLQESGGKRVRPCLLLLCAKLCGQTDASAIQLAAVVEFIHAATLVHDDIIDGAETRRGRTTVHRKWGNQVTVLAGDWLYMQSFYVALRQRNFQILDILIDLTQRMVEGELIQLSLNGNRRISEAEVLDIAKRKTAYLFAGCARIGGVLGGAPIEKQEALASYGLNVGLAFQMIDDILDFSSTEKVLGKPVVSDLKEGKLTLPLIYALQKCSLEEARKIETVLREQEFRTVSAKEILTLVEKYGTLDTTYTLARKFAAAATASLQPFPASPHKEALEAIPQFILEREK
jgi:octaprenyl-diphosphate synthase